MKPWMFSCTTTKSYSLHSTPVSEILLLMSDSKLLHTSMYIGPCLQSLYITSNVKSCSMFMKYSEKFVLTPASSTKYTNGLLKALKWIPLDLIFAILNQYYNISSTKHIFYYSIIIIRVNWCICQPNPSPRSLTGGLGVEMR